MKIDYSDNLYLTGTQDLSTYNYEIVTLKYNTAGNLLFAKNYSGAGSKDASKNILVDKNLNIYVNGEGSISDSTMRGLLTMKYSQPIGIINSNNEIPKKFNLHQNYPNPFNPSTVIKFDLPKKSKVSLILFNLIGQKIKELINSELNAGTYSLNIDLTGFSSGIYFYKLETPEFTETKKLILLK